MKRRIAVALSLLLVGVGCGPSVSSSDPKKRVQAVTACADQALLAKVAVSDGAPEVRVAAVSRLEDQALLVRIATEQPSGLEDWKQRTEEKNLAILVKQNADPRALEEAEKSGRPVFIDPMWRFVARMDIEIELSKIRRAAVGRIKDQRVLGRLAREDSDGGVRGAAVERLEDQAVLAAIAAQDGAPGVREAAQKRLRELRK